MERDQEALGFHKLPGNSVWADKPVQGKWLVEVRQQKKKERGFPKWEPDGYRTVKNWRRGSMSNLETRACVHGGPDSQVLPETSQKPWSPARLSFIQRPLYYLLPTLGFLRTLSQIVTRGGEGCGQEIKPITVRIWPLGVSCSLLTIGGS